MSATAHLLVIPAKAGTHTLEPFDKGVLLRVWVPTFVGMTIEEVR